MSKFVHQKPRYSIKDVVELIDISRTTLWAETANGNIAHYLVGKRKFYSPEAIDAYIEKCQKENQL